MTRFRIDLRGAAFRRVLGFAFRHWRRQPLRLAAIAAAMLTATVADVLMPLVTGRLIDTVANTARPASWSHALPPLLFLLGLGATGLAMRQIVFYQIIRFTLRIMSEVVSGVFYRVQRFSTDWHANSFAGSTVRKIGRGMWAFDLLNDTLLMALLPSTAMLVGSTILLGWYWPIIGAIVAMGSIGYVAMTVGLSLGFVAPAASLANQWDTRLGGVLADAITCNAVVKSFGAEAREDERLGWVIGKWRRRTDRVWRRGTLNAMVQGLALLILQAAIIGLALSLWVGGAAGAGDIAFVLTAFFMLQGYLRDVGLHIRNLQRSVNDMEDLVAMDALSLGIVDRADAGPIKITRGLVEFASVTFHYGDHRDPLYRDFSVTIAAGERVGLVGPSGSGKTTFVKLIQRLYDVTDGRIMIDGQDIRTVTQMSLREHIALVQQDPILFHRSLADNIAYAKPGASPEEIEAAARLAGAHAFITRLPKGYATLVGERGIKLSGGERQRVAIARAFLADAPILILDEATSSLDSDSEALIQQAMQRLMIGRTTLIIAHRLSTVRALDRLLVFDRGRIVEEGDHEALIRREGGIYRHLFEQQALDLARGLIKDEPGWPRGTGAP